MVETTKPPLSSASSSPRSNNSCIQRKTARAVPMTRKHLLLSMLIMLAVAVSLLATCCNHPKRQHVLLVQPYLVSYYDDDDDDNDKHNDDHSSSNTNNNNNENENNHATMIVLDEPELLQPLQEEEGKDDNDEEPQPEHQGEFDNDDDDDEPPITTTTNITTMNNRIPPIVWMFWDDGWPASNPEANLALYSFRRCLLDRVVTHDDDDNNNTIQKTKWTIRPLDTITAERLSQRKRYILDDNFFFHNLTVQARSDVYRTLLLYRYGGIWADASLFCNIPIPEWRWFETKTDDLHLQPQNNNNNITTTTSDDLISLVRHDNVLQQRQLDIAPWITSWFLASPPRGYTITRLVEQYFLLLVDHDDSTQQHDRLTAEYFWWHRMISELARSDDRVAANIRTFGSADPSHCLTNHNANNTTTTSVPLYKRCKTKPMYAVMATTRYCCDSHNDDYYFPPPPPPPQSSVNIMDTDNSNNNNNSTNMTLLFGARMQSLCAIWNCSGRPTDHLVDHGGDNNSRIATAWGTNNLTYFQSLFAHG